MTLLVSAYFLLAAFATKAPCVIGNRPARPFCYSDIQTLWSQRDLRAHALPYIHGGLIKTNVGGSAGLRFTGHEIEYPVLTGLFAWLTSLPAKGQLGFLFTSALALAPFAMVTAWLLHRLVGRRAFLFCAAPTLVWYAFLNWDVLVAASIVGAIYAWHRGRLGWCGVILGAGACLKGWPALLLMPVIIDLVSRRASRDALRCVAGATGIALSANGPFILANFTGWRAPFQFQSERAVDLASNSLWPYLSKGAVAVTTANHLSEAACAIAIATILWVGWRRAGRTGVFPVVQACAAITASFVALGRVHSPQYALWVLPFLPLLRMRVYWWLAFVVTDAWLFCQWTILPGWPALLRSAVLLSDLVLLAIAVQAMRSEPAIATLGLGGPCPPAEGEQAVGPITETRELVGTVVA